MKRSGIREMDDAESMNIAYRLRVPRIPALPASGLQAGARFCDAHDP